MTVNNKYSILDLPCIPFSVPFPRTINTELEESGQLLYDQYLVDDFKKFMKYFNNSCSVTIKDEKHYDNEEEENDGIIYILQRAAASALQQPIFKVGRTTNMERRFKQYEKGAILLYQKKVKEHIKVEKLCIAELRNKFALVQGRETFKADPNEMMCCVDKIVREYEIPNL